MSLQKYLEDKLNTFYDSFVMHIGSNIDSGYVAVRHNGKTIDAKVVSPLKAGKILIIKTGESYFAIQDEEVNRGATKVQENEELFQADDDDEISILIFVLSEKLPINIEYRDNYDGDKSLIPNIQVVEDIYLIDGLSKFKNLKEKDMRLDEDESKVIEPYLTFFSFLIQTKYKSFYNYLTGTKTRKEGLGISSFKLDEKKISRTKLKLFDYPFMFPDSSLYSKFVVRTGVLKEIVFPYEMEEKVDERPDRIATFEEVLLKFYSTVKEDTPDTALDWVYLPEKIKNLGVLNTTFPIIKKWKENKVAVNDTYFEYPMAIDVVEYSTKLNLTGHPQWKEVWKSNTSYVEDDVVEYDSNFYQCILDNSDTEFNGANWKRLTFRDKEWNNENITKFDYILFSSKYLLALEIDSNTEIPIDDGGNISGKWLDISNYLSYIQRLLYEKDPYEKPTPIKLDYVVSNLVFVGTIGIIKILGESIFIHPVGALKVKVKEKDDETQEISYIRDKGQEHPKKQEPPLEGKIKVSNYDLVVVGDIGYIIEENGKIYFVLE